LGSRIKGEEQCLKQSEHFSVSRVGNTVSAERSCKKVLYGGAATATLYF
jgi:hypothetical protein